MTDKWLKYFIKNKRLHPNKKFRTILRLSVKKYKSLHKKTQRKRKIHNKSREHKHQKKHKTLKKHNRKH